MIVSEILRPPRRHQTLTTTMIQNKHNRSTVQPVRPSLRENEAQRLKWFVLWRSGAVGAGESQLPFETRWTDSVERQSRTGKYVADSLILELDCRRRRGKELNILMYA